MQASRVSTFFHPFSPTKKNRSAGASERVFNKTPAPPTSQTITFHTKTKAPVRKGRRAGGPQMVTQVIRGAPQHRGELFSPSPGGVSYFPKGNQRSPPRKPELLSPSRGLSLQQMAPAPGLQSLPGLFGRLGPP